MSEGGRKEGRNVLIAKVRETKHEKEEENKRKCGNMEKDRRTTERKTREGRRKKMKRMKREMKSEGNRAT